MKSGRRRHNWRRTVNNENRHGKRRVYKCRKQKGLNRLQQQSNLSLITTRSIRRVIFVHIDHAHLDTICHIQDRRYGHPFRISNNSLFRLPYAVRHRL